MSVTFWTIIIFVLSKWPANGLCLTFDVDSKSFICRAVAKRDPWIGNNVVKRTSDLNCSITAILGQQAEKRRVLKILNTTRHYLRIITSRNCDNSRVKYTRCEIHCTLSKEESRDTLNNSASARFVSSKRAVYYINLDINRTGLIRNAFLASRRSKGFLDAEALRRLTKLDRRYLNVFICIERGDWIEREIENESSRRRDRVFGKNLARKKRNILENSTTAFPTYSSNTIIASYPITPPLTRIAQNTSSTSSRRATQVWSSCPPSMIVNRSMIFRVVATSHTGSLVPTGELTPLKHISATSLLRNNTFVAATSNSVSAFNATLTGSIVRLENTTQHTAYIYNKNLVSVICTTEGSAFITTLDYATVTSKTETSIAKPTLRTTTESDTTEHTKLYIGLISGGGVLLFIIICIALFLLVRRYRRIKALRRKAKQISYFNRFDCSSAWDEPDRFGGSKLSVFTLKNSKFDIDWESTNDSKQ